MFLKSHRFIQEPYFKTEIRQSFNVRESFHTAMPKNERYLDIDTGKYDTDKIPTLTHSSLADIMVPEVNQGLGYLDYQKRYSKQSDHHQQWFTPKDDDFEEECATETYDDSQDELEKIAEQQAEIDDIIQQEKARLKSILHEEVYHLVMQEAERQAKEKQYARVLKNTWIVK